MLRLHIFLDRYLKKRLSFSVFFRIWLSLAFLIAFIGLTSFYALQKTIRPSAKRVVEDTLVDTSRLLSVLVADDVADFLAINNPAYPLALNFKSSSYHQSLWYDQKDNSQFHLYITDTKGKVIYDSWGLFVGDDFSRWNDVYLTLQGKYGARSSEINGSSVMYVASPIIKDGVMIGVLSVGKPTVNLSPYIDISQKQLIKILLQSTLFSLVVALFIAMWLRHSIASINRYTQSLARVSPPHFYLANELNELTANIKDMKDTIENKAYVTDYVHTLTHELKSPLSAIRASSELLADDMEQADREYFSRLIGEQSVRMTSLIDRLLVLAKLEQPNFVPNLECVNVGDIARICLDNQLAQIKNKQIKTITYNENQEILIKADRFWITQAIQNLVDNAIIHALSLVVVIVLNNKLLIINDSSKLPDYVLDRAFERYFSFHQDNTLIKGTGLGLPLVAQIMEHHGGQVSLEQVNFLEFQQKLQAICIKAWECLSQEIGDVSQNLISQNSTIVIATLMFDTHS